MSESNTLNLTGFKPTPVVKKLSKSNSSENLNLLTESPQEQKPVVKKTRGRKSKYTNDEERKEARRQQQREYRLRKKHELDCFRRMAEEKTSE